MKITCKWRALLIEVRMEGSVEEKRAGKCYWAGVS